MKDIKVLAILAGAVADFMSSNYIGFRFGVQLGFLDALGGNSGEKLKDLLHEQMHSIPFLLFGALLGCAGTVLGGFVTARIAGTARLKNAAIMGVCSVLDSIPLWHGDFPVWYHVLGVIVTPFAAVCGGLLAQAAFDEPR